MSKPSSSFPFGVLMAKVYPQTPIITSSSSSSSYITSRKETFTVWLKSLLFNGNGCTVFDSNGKIVYRMDNYDGKCSGEVYLMDLQGNVLYSVQQKKQGVLGCWDGYKWNNSKVEEEIQSSFRVRKISRILGGGDMTCHVSLGDGNSRQSFYQMAGLAGKSAFKIIDHEGGLVAEAKQKQSSSGVKLGNDVLTLVVEHKMDHSLIMALVTVYALINHKL